ncbi:MAG: acyloxyacyl hydrolase [bacterium]
MPTINRITRSTKFCSDHFSMIMLIMCCLYGTQVFSQENENTQPIFTITPELIIGQTGEANDEFADRGLQKQLVVSFGWNHTKAHGSWTSEFPATRSGFTLGYTDFGNSDELGIALSALSFLEFNAFKSDRFKVHIGTGLSYFNRKFNIDTNPNNKAVSTDLTWSFRLFSHYKLYEFNKTAIRAGLGYTHHSNGHSKLPNQGYNSFLVSVSADINSFNYEKTAKEYDVTEEDTNRYDYLVLKPGIGQNALSRTFNDKKPVYVMSLEYGRVYNRMYKVGIGFYYRFYQNYYDYIDDNESLVQDGREFSDLRDNAFWNASNIGLTLNGELLLNHIGIDVQFGFNIHKPAYGIDWRINEGWEIVPQVIPEESNIVLGELNTKYRIKKLISSRFGLKYYFIDTQKAPKHNLYVGAFINANLGQADFTELGLGYMLKLN